MGIEITEARGGAPVGERLRTLLGTMARGAEAAQLAVFARVLLRGTDYPGVLTEEAAAALVLSAFRFLSAPGPDLRVRVVTPTFPTEGWEGDVTVIETCIGDRPFIVDTVRARLEAAGIEVRALLHPIFTTQRDPTGRLERLGPPEEAGTHESFLHVAVVPVGDAAARARLADDLRAALEDVRLVTDDFAAMVGRAHVLAQELEAADTARPAQLAAEAAAVADLLRWLVDGGFVFLGYREYGTAGGGVPALVARAGTSLGLLRGDRHGIDEPALAPDERMLAVSKTLAAAPVHRRACMDDLMVRELDTAGRVIGARRFVGLFTSKAYGDEASEIPLLRRVLRQVVAAEQVVPGSHDHKEIVELFNALSKPVLFAGTAASIRGQIRAIRESAQVDDVVVAVRPLGPAGRLAVLVVLPRDRFSSEAQERIRELVASHLDGVLVDEHLVLAVQGRAVLDFVVALPPDAPLPEDAGALTAAVRRIVRTWQEGLHDVLLARHGGDGVRLATRFATAFPVDYRAAVDVERAADDVVRLDTVLRDGRMQVAFRNDGDAQATSLQLFSADAPIGLSEAMGMLENLGLRALAEDRVPLHVDGRALFLQTFLVQDRRLQRLDVTDAGPRLADTLTALRTGLVENDVLNRLVLEAGLVWRAVDCLRAYAGYAVQAGLGAREVVRAALADHPEPSRLLFDCLAHRFRPDDAAGEPTAGAALRQRFLASLDAVQSLRQDTLLRALLDIVEATVRTNAFTREPGPSALAFKLRSADLAQLPAPRPLYEIYVHAPTMEGVHLRAGKIARGGIRHSDRPDDFRTEVLGLMKTQNVKNALIVPMGAKGGFVVKGPLEPATVVAAYTTFIRALLDLTDNLVDGRVVHPPGLVIHDEEDPYLVVAADKGTARFSDIANDIAVERGFWLGDAFASGGSHGYDHKALGITARGVWECVRTHFRSAGVDADTAPLVVAGIGDMGGDVFGNGLLRSPHLRLRVAFNHQHVFVDPEPDPARSFAERERLFRAGLGWGSYDPAALSAGGAVVSRSAKRVALSPEARAVLGLGDAEVSGEQLVRAVLSLDADLLFNGGVGTYVGGSHETDAEIRDAVNDPVRIRASALRARVVAEGGNLGLTQQARVEYAVAGGRVNTDAVDNSAGVDMSDHEVNLKICLQAVVATGQLSPEARNALLAEIAPDVVERVLAHNRAQSRLLTIEEIRSRTRLVDFRDLTVELERTVGLDRALEGLPERDALRRRRATFQGLTRPELAVLMAYTKIHLQRALLASRLPDDALFAPALAGYFPEVVAQRFPAAVARHPLRREIVASELVNTLVDHVGTTFVSRVMRDTGASVVDALRAWGIAWTLVRGAELTADLAGAGVSAEDDAVGALALERITEGVTRWLLDNTESTRAARDVVAGIAPTLARVRERLPEWMVGTEAEAFHKRVTELEMTGLPAALARELTIAEWLTGALDVLSVARDGAIDVEQAAARYYGLGQHVDFAWLWARLAEVDPADRWQRRAAEGLASDALDARRRLARREPSALPAATLAAIAALTRDLRALPHANLAALQVMVHELRRLADTVSAGDA